VEVFSIDYNMGVINKVKVISLDSSTSDMMSIAFSLSRKLFFMGHKSGILSAFSTDAQNFLVIAGYSKFHDGV
jgi:hypothetical protein